MCQWDGRSERDERMEGMTRVTCGRPMLQWEDRDVKMMVVFHYRGKLAALLKESDTVASRDVRTGMEKQRQGRSASWNGTRNKK